MIKKPIYRFHLIAHEVCSGTIGRWAFVFFREHDRAKEISYFFIAQDQLQYSLENSLACLVRTHWAPANYSAAAWIQSNNVCFPKPQEGNSTLRGYWNSEWLDNTFILAVSNNHFEINTLSYSQYACCTSHSNAMSISHIFLPINKFTRDKEGEKSEDIRII